MKKDIENRADIDDLMRVFYTKALTDEEIGCIFEIAELDLEKHLPVIGDFWESLLLSGKNYQMRGRNPMQIHAELNEKTPLKAKHFRRWLEIFQGTVDEMFAGEIANHAKKFSVTIADRMQNFIRNMPPLETMNRETPATIRGVR